MWLVGAFVRQFKDFISGHLRKRLFERISFHYQQVNFTVDHESLLTDLKYLHFSATTTTFKHLYEDVLGSHLTGAPSRQLFPKYFRVLEICKIVRHNK